MKTAIQELIDLWRKQKEQAINESNGYFQDGIYDLFIKDLEEIGLIIERTQIIEAYDEGWRDLINYQEGAYEIVTAEEYYDNKYKQLKT